MPPALLVALSWLLCSPLTLLEAWDAAATAQLQARLDALRRAGEPVTLAELAATYPEPPQGQNAAPLYERAFALMDERDAGGAAEEPWLPYLGRGHLPEPHEPLPPAMRRAIQAALKPRADVLQLLHQAAEKEGCRFALDFRDGLGMQLPHLAKMRQAARLLALEALDRIEAGRAEQAADSLVAALRLGRALSQEPLLISALVRVACDAIAVRQLERWASRCGPAPEDLRRVETALRAEADPRLLERALVGERCFGMDAYRAHALGPEPAQALEALGAGDVPAGLLRLAPRAYFKSDMVCYIDLMGEYVAAAREPAPRGFLRVAQVGEELEERVPRHYVLSRMLLPALGRVGQAAQWHVAQLQSARVALAALRYRAKHGRLPRSLPALVPAFLDAVPADPFDGKPLRCRATPEGFTVYAIGKNGRDDGGRVDPEDREALDAGFRVLWPKAEF